MRIKYFLLIGLMSLLTAAVYAVSNDHTSSSPDSIETIQHIPLHFGEWKGFDQPLAPLVYEILETESIIHRTYRNHEEKEVFVSIVYYNETKVDFHAPESCLGGQGIRTDKSPAELTIKTGSGEKIILEAYRLLQDQDNDATLVYYFFKSGDFIGRNYIQLRLHLVLNKFTSARKSGSLIRVSTPLAGYESDKDATTLLEGFLGGLYPFIIEYL